jgi:prepilin-type N-terminal cleavage/methylation domain-containing protein
MIKSLNKNKRAGFSILEVIITLFIISIIGLLIIKFQLDIFSLNKISSNNLIVQTDMRRALKNMSAEIRSMSPSSLGAYPIIQNSTSSLAFYSNVDSDIFPEKIRYFLVENTLKKGVTKPSGDPLIYNPANETVRDLVHNVVNEDEPIFSYYDTNYDGNSPALTEPVDALLVRLIKINIIVNSSVTDSQTPTIMTTQVSIRNIKDNL